MLGPLTVQHYLILGTLIFGIGAIGVVVRRNAVVLLMCVEMMLNSVGISFVALAREFRDINGQVIVFFVMAVAAAEVAVGLSILVACFHARESLDVDEINLMKW